MNSAPTISGNNLIFLISQPRSGSTLLQRILATHAQISTLAEPWIMLPLLYETPFEPRMEKPYNASMCARATTLFLESLPAGRQEYYEAARLMALRLYQRSLEISGKQRFLDKTPRYYCIIPQLAKTFPDAKFILLARNPLAVLGSIIHSWTGESWHDIAQYKRDLLDAPRQMVEGAQLLGGNACYVRYEDLIAEPENVVGNICRYLEIEFLPGMVAYGKHNLPTWQLGASGVYKHSAPVADNADKWKKSLHDPQVWRLYRDYLEALDEDTLRRFGYERAGLVKELKDAAPSAKRLAYTYSLTELLHSAGGPASSLSRLKMRLCRALQLKGHRGTAVRAVQKLLEGFR